MDKKTIMKKVGIPLVALGVISGGYFLWQYKLSVPIDDLQLGKNVVKNSKVVEQANDKQLKSVKANVKDANDIRAILRTKYSKNFNESSTVEWDEKLNLYEVVNGLQILYITPNGKNVISGHVYDLQTGLDYTEIRLAEVSKINVNELPLNKFVKIVNGNGNRVIYVFTYLDDQFKEYYNTTLSNINNSSIYILINQATPNVNDDEYLRIYKQKLFKSIYCSDDSERELKNYLKPAKWNPLTNLVDNCDKKINDDNIDSIFNKYKILWSPTLFLENGYRYKALPIYQLNQILDKNEKESNVKVKTKGVSSELGLNKESSKPIVKKTEMGSNS